MYELLLKIVKKIVNNSNGNFNDKSKQSQLKYIYKYSNIKYKNEFIDRSYYQYKSQIYLSSNMIKIIILNILSIPVILLFIIYGITNNFKYRSKKEYLNRNNVAINLGYQNVLPNLLKKEFFIQEGVKNFILNKQDLYFFLNEVFFKYPLSIYFNLKILVKIALYSFNINKFECKAILVNSEYSYTSSILTLYLNSNNIEHINFMHGEKLFNIRDSFCRFNRFYVWDQYYAELFEEMQHYKKQFIIDVPELQLYKSTINNNSIKYYLQNENIEELKNIYFLLKKFKDRGYNVVVRLHPRYSNRDDVNDIFIDIDIEDDIDIVTSINECKYVISKFSTVLFQAYLLNKEIIVDDISNKELYKNLKEFGYIILNKNHTLLSQII